MSERNVEKSSEILEKFIKSWQEEIPKIENRAIDSEGVYRIYENFRKDVLLYLALEELKGFDNQFNEINVIGSKLVVALETARSRYRLENRGLWARIAEGIGGLVWRIPKTN